VKGVGEKGWGGEHGQRGKENKAPLTNDEGGKGNWRLLVEETGLRAQDNESHANKKISQRARMVEVEAEAQRGFAKRNWR